MTESSHAGRPSSWIAVAVVIAGFALGGIGLITGPSWVLFWSGVAVVAVGGLVLILVGAFSDVVMAEPRANEVEITDTSIFGNDGEGRGVAPTGRPPSVPPVVKLSSFRTDKPSELHFHGLIKLNDNAGLVGDRWVRQRLAQT